MHFAVAAEYKRAPFCPRGVLRRPPSIAFSLSLSLLSYHHLYSMHTLIRSVRTYTHECAPFALLLLTSSPPSVSLLLPSTRFFFRSLCLFLRVDLEGSSEGMLRAARAQLARY